MAPRERAQQKLNELGTDSQTEQAQRALWVHREQAEQAAQELRDRQQAERSYRQ